MKYANAALLAILNSGADEFIYADLYKFELRNGETIYWTDWQVNVVKDSVTYLATKAILNGTQYRLTRGLEVSECSFELIPFEDTLINGITVLKAAQNGLFDRAIVTKYRLFLTETEAASIPINEPSANALLLFLGEATDIVPFGNSITFSVKSMTNLLNIMMPRRQYQPRCSYTFGDSNCQFVRSSLAVSGSATVATTTSNLVTDLTNDPGYFNNGTIYFTSGKNQGITRTVKNYSSGNVTLVAPFPSQVENGDQFTATPGCNKNYAGATTSANAAARTGSTVSQIISSLKYADGYFIGGSVTFTSGNLKGQTRTVTNWASGIATVSPGFTETPQVGDSFTISTISTNVTGSCTGYSNTSHFGGFPYVPVPETSF